MEKIAKALEEQLGLHVRGRPEKKEETCRCDTCGHDFEGEVTTYLIRRRVEKSNYPGAYDLVDDVKVYRQHECPACKAERKRKEREDEDRGKWEENLAWRITTSKIPLVSREEQRIETFHRLKGKSEAHAEALAYVQSEPPEHYFITFIGQTGRGKTHLALAIGWHFLEKTGKTVRFYQAQDLLDDLRAGFHIKGIPERGEDFDKMLAAVKNCGVLIIDDLGAENETSWAGSTFDSIINYRYARHFRTVFTSNVEPEKLPERISSRIQEGIVCVVTGIDYRILKRKRQQRE